MASGRSASLTSALKRLSIAAPLVRPAFLPRPTPPAISCFSTSSVLSESKRKRNARRKKKANIELQARLRADYSSHKPDPVLGYGPGEEHVWESSELKSILLVPAQVYASASAGESVVQPAEGETFPGIPLPRLLNSAIPNETVPSLFQTLPSLAAQRAVMGAGRADLLDEERQREVVERERAKLDMMARVLDLRNASARGIMLENFRRCIVAFGRHGGGEGPTNQGDTGSAETQAALLTTRIRFLYEHLKTHTRDIENRRSLRAMVMQRVKVLKHLKRTHPDRYNAVLPRLGLLPRAVEMEISGVLV